MDTNKLALAHNATDFGWPDVQSPTAGQDSMQFKYPPPQTTNNTDLQQLWFSTTTSNYWQTRYPSTYPPGPPSGSGLSRESSRDDLTSMELEQVFDYEERFRVDRRKLELLILGRYEPIEETAAEYFQKVLAYSIQHLMHTFYNTRINVRDYVDNIRSLS